MNDNVEHLILRAGKLTSTIKRGPGTRYPQELKDIVTKLRVDYKFSVAKICKHVEISSYSAREWPKKNKSSFNKILVTPFTKAKPIPPKIVKKESSKDMAIIFNQVILAVLLTLLLFEKIFYHLAF